MSAGLAYTHSQHITYRDMKSSNILVWQFPLLEDLLGVSPGSECNTSSFPVAVKLADFGISRRTAHTGVKGTQGTVGFMAPEIIAYGGSEVYTEQVREGGREL